MNRKHVILIFANLKPSQVIYKIIPLSQSAHVERVIILRKRFIDIKNEKIICHSIPSFIRIRPFYWLLTVFYGIYLIKRYKVSLILNYNILPHGVNACIASLFTGKPFIFSEINEDTIKYFKHALFRPIIKKILSRALFITVPGSSIEQFWKKQRFFNLIRQHSTLDTDSFMHEGQTKPGFDFIYIGEFDNNKRPELILEAFIAIREMGINATMCFIGFGKKETGLRKSIAMNRLNDHVSLIKTDQVKSLLIDSRVLVMASLSEGIPCAMLEAMACKRVVVVPSTGDIIDVVKHGYNGFIHNNTFGDIVKWMKYALENYSSLEKLRQNARQTIIDEHSYQVAIKRWDKLFGELLEI